MLRTTDIKIPCAILGQGFSQRGHLKKGNIGPQIRRHTDLIGTFEYKIVLWYGRDARFLKNITSVFNHD